MIKNIISLILTLVSVFFSLKHGWDSFNIDNSPETVQMMAQLGINAAILPYFGAISIFVGIFLLFPKTFILGNIVHATTIVLIMILASVAGVWQMALMEIPFLMIPLVLIFLKYPFKDYIRKYAKQ